jgi:hypothetical protein
MKKKLFSCFLITLLCILNFKYFFSTIKIHSQLLSKLFNIWFFTHYYLYSHKFVHIHKYETFLKHYNFINAFWRCYETDLIYVCTVNKETHCKHNFVSSWFCKSFCIKITITAVFITWIITDKVTILKLLKLNHWKMRK